MAEDGTFANYPWQEKACFLDGEQLAGVRDLLRNLDHLKSAYGLTLGEYGGLVYIWFDEKLSPLVVDHTTTGHVASVGDLLT